MGRKTVTIGVVVLALILLLCVFDAEQLSISETTSPSEIERVIIKTPTPHPTFTPRPDSTASKRSGMRFTSQVNIEGLLLEYKEASKSSVVRTPKGTLARVAWPGHQWLLIKFRTEKTASDAQDLLDKWPAFWSSEKNQPAVWLIQVSQNKEVGYSHYLVDDQEITWVFIVPEQANLKDFIIVFPEGYGPNLVALSSRES